MFAAIFNADRSPVSLPAMGLAADELRVVAASGHVALLRSREPSPAHEQETSAILGLAGGPWLVGRIRLDSRDDLAASLGRAATDDGLLCLHAYEKWGETFVDHIAGDFCFVLWDEARGRLLAVRDQFGVRALFHTRVGNTWVLSDSLAWLASWKAVDRELDDYWVVDFLGFNHPLDFDTTAYRDIRRLPPAHVLSLSTAGQNMRRYWRLEVEEPLYLRDGRLYGERFRELTTRAIVDRLPAGRVGIAMSGGLDSTTLAACAASLSSGPAKIVANSVHYETLIADEEVHYAKIAAAHIGIELDLRAFDNDVYDPLWRSFAVATPEPWAGITNARPEQVALRSMARQADVWLEGEGPDNALRFERDAYLSWLVRQRRWGRLAEACWLYVRFRGFGGWRLTYRRYFGSGNEPNPKSSLPSWLNRDLVRRLDLEERLEVSERGSQPPHPWHPRSIASFRDPIWQGILAGCDVEETLAPLVWRHPYLDLRVMQFLLSLPPVPWARRKLVIRQAMKGRLPPEILARDKRPLQGDPTASALRQRALPPLEAATRLGRWIDLDRFAAAGAATQGVVSVHALDYWLAAR